MTGLSAGGNVTVSMGAGTGSLTMVSSITSGSFTIDGSNFAGGVHATRVKHLVRPFHYGGQFSEWNSHGWSIYSDS